MKHRQKIIVVPRKIAVDEAIADEILVLNHAGVVTEGSCQGPPPTALIRASCNLIAINMDYCPEYIEDVGLYKIILKGKNKMLLHQENLIELGLIIKEKRHECGRSQMYLANAVGISRNYLSMIERGIANNPSWLIIQSLLFAVGLHHNEYKPFKSTISSTDIKRECYD